MPAKTLSLLLAGVMAVSAAAAIGFDTWYRDDLQAEGVLCKAWLCASDLVQARAHELMWAGDVSSAREAVKAYRRVLERNPASPDHWADLGEAFAVSGNQDLASYSYGRAVDLGPSSPAILMRAANYHLAAGPRPAAFSRLSRVLQLTREYDEVIFSLLERFQVEPDEVVRFVLPAERAAGQSYFLHLINRKSLSAAEIAWPWLSSHGFADDQLFALFLNLLVEQRAYERALSAWRTHFGEPEPENVASHYILNGGFEKRPRSLALGWQIVSTPHVEVSRDPSVFRNGSWSLRLRFDGTTNVVYSHARQNAVVQPGPACFRAHVRSKGITTDQGLRFRIRDAEDASRLDIGAGHVLGTGDWSRVETYFVIPEQTRLLLIQIQRRPSRRFNNRIAGTAWIDDISLQALDDPGTR